VALRELEGAVGAPWARPLAGALDELVVESDTLSDNPLGDPARRPLYVYRPPGVELDHPVGLPTIYIIQGFTGQVDMWLSRSALEPTMVERVDAMFAARASPDAILVFVDAWTSRGGSQFINSASTGRYLDYLCDEVVAFVDQRYPTVPDRDHRGLAGKSSGGYGAMVVPMLRPDVFGALASHAGDALFESCYQREFPVVARTLRDHFDGSYEVYFERLAQSDHFDWSRYGPPFEMYGYASAYSPDLSQPGKALLPFEISTGRLIDDVWALWLEHDPVRMAPYHADALRRMHRIYLDAGKSDEYFLDLGAQAFANELEKLGVAYTLELFDGKHGGITYRYPGAIRQLATALHR
jgi:S-formylglutathione hydrolase FrmB